MSDHALRIVQSLAEVDRQSWDRVANPPGEPFDPFLSWDFLEALERSGSATPETGWGGFHLLCEGADGTLLGAAPLYLKGHSYGEYVFDHGWANAYERAGGRYYPKLLSAAPFTPATGRRILSPDPDVRGALIEGALSVCRREGLSSWHVLFPDASQRDELAAAGLLRRYDIQFIWRNDDYETYEDFLGALASRKRKALRKERKSANEDVEIERLTGDAIQPEHWDLFFACYQDTGARKWGTPYLTRAFFDLMHERMREQILLVTARREGAYIASALNFIGSETLFGRYWGCLEDREFLHFELCYHQAVEFAIERGLRKVEAGAQGPHKLARGYRPEVVHSAHFIPDPGFSDAVGRFLARERPAVEAEILSLDEESPYKREP